MADEDKEFTQAELDTAVEAARAEEAAKYPDYNQIKTENDKLKTDLATRDEQLLDALKTEIVKAHNLPEAMTARIQGATRDELEADAKSLSDALGVKKKTGDGTNPATKTKTIFTRSDLEGMSADEINKNWDIISGQLKAGSLNV